MEKLNSIIKVDLHVHSIASAYKEDSDIVKDSKIENLNTILNKLEENEINLFAFSDHNRFDFDLYKNAKVSLKDEKFKHLRGILPAVEFDVCYEEHKESCHTLAIFSDVDEEKLKSLSSLLNDGKYCLKNPNDVFSLDLFEDLLFEVKLPVILIACQRQSLFCETIGNNSFNSSVTDPFVFLKTGYISALEYQTPRVQGIIKNDLKDFDIKVPLVCGSDCHDWDKYPYHDKKEKEKLGEKQKSFYFEIKALPTFMGLLMAITSPATRFRRNPGQNSCIASFKIGEEIIQLSNGFNAIIGENGSGKTTLLAGLCLEKQPGYAKKLLSNNNFSCSKNVEYNEIKTIEQGQIIANNNANSNNIFGDETLFKSPDISDFVDSINKYKESLIAKIESQISLRSSIIKLSSYSFHYEKELENNKTYYVNVQISEKYGEIQNVYSKQLIDLNNIIRSLNNLFYNTNLDEYEKESIQNAYSSLLQLRMSFVSKYNKIQTEASVKNIMVSKIAEYKKKVSELSSDLDEKIEDYETQKTNLVDNVVKTIKSKIACSLLKLSNIEFLSKIGENITRGFKFVSTPSYAGETDIKDQLLSYCFNEAYKKEEQLLKIETTAEANSAVSRVKTTYQERLNDLVNDFIKEKSVLSYYVLDITSDSKMGTTLGEKSLVFYKYVSNAEFGYKVIAIDQPEDNISNYKIFHELINYFSTLRDKCQMIFVTHNPMLVVNLDVDNVIYIQNNNGKFSIDYGALESPSILKNVSEIMDGGKEALEKRLKIYE